MLPPCQLLRRENTGLPGFGSHRKLNNKSNRKTRNDQPLNPTVRREVPQNVAAPKASLLDRYCNDDRLKTQAISDLHERRIQVTQDTVSGGPEKVGSLPDPTQVPRRSRAPAD